MHFLVLYYGRTQGIAPDGQAADNEPLSRADKARGVSPNKYRLFRAVNPPEKVVNRYTDIISDTR